MTFNKPKNNKSFPSSHPQESSSSLFKLTNLTYLWVLWD